jgi:hypothetical protein
MNQPSVFVPLNIGTKPPALASAAGSDAPVFAGRIAAAAALGADNAVRCERTSRFSSAESATEHTRLRL